MSGNPLSRWSRRKDEARRSRLGPSQSDEGAKPAPEAGRESTDDLESTATETAPTAEEIAALPKLEELTADSDITGFLRRGVPEALRNAALRKMWLLDPAIRDFAGHARDYDFDWNTPGGVPGNSPLESGDHTAGMLRHVVEERDEPPASELAGEIAQDRPGVDISTPPAPGPRPGAPPDKGGTGAGGDA